MNKDASSGVTPAPWPCEHCPDLDRACPCESAEAWAGDMRRQVAELNTEAAAMREAVELGARWMQWWLDQDECDCEDGHHCGRNERQKELDSINAALSQPHAQAAHERWRAMERFVKVWEQLDRALLRFVAKHPDLPGDDDLRQAMFDSGVARAELAGAPKECLAALRGEVGR